MAKKELKAAGLKVTLPRLKILRILEATKERHISAEGIYQALKTAGDDVGLATVYRVLTQFETAGLLRRHQFEEDHSLFELDMGEHHDHLVCVTCSAIQEFVDPMIEARQAEIAEGMGFDMTDHNLTIYGICQTCQKSQA